MHFALFLFVCRKHKSSSRAHPLSLLFDWLPLQNKQWALVHSETDLGFLQGHCLKLSSIVVNSYPRAEQSCSKAILEVNFIFIFSESFFLDLYALLSLLPHLRAA